MISEELVKKITEIVDPKENETPILSKHAIKMNYSPFEGVKDGLRRCGNCGDIFPIAEFKRKKPGYEWRCKGCIKFNEEYK